VSPSDEVRVGPGGATPPWATARAVWSAGLSLLALIALVLILWRGREVVAWLGIAFLLAVILDLPARSLERLRVPRGTAVLAVLAAALGLFVTLVVFLAPRLSAHAAVLLREVPVIEQRIERPGVLGWFAAHLHGLRSFGESVHAGGAGSAGPLLHVFRTAGHLTFATVTILVVAAYMLVSGQDLVAGMIGQLPQERRSRWQALASKIRWVVGRYVAALFLRAFILGAASAIMLGIMGVPYFLALGLILTVLGIVPLVGPILGGVLVVAAATWAAGPPTGLLALGLYLALNQLDNHLLAPVLQRRVMDMHPLITLTVSLLGISAAGALGAALAVPLAAVVQLVLAERQPGRAPAVQGP
jgi:predicted PurR-regulated permease PerM